MTEEQAEYGTHPQGKNLYQRLVEAVEKLPKEAVETATKEVTRKGYDTTGYQYQYLVNILNEVAGLGRWNFTWKIIKEISGNYASGKSFWDITAEVSIMVEGNTMSCAGGHRSENYADALKGAITNGFKKTAAFFGVGIKAYQGILDEDYRQEAEGAVAVTTNQPSPQTSNPVPAPRPITGELPTSLINVESVMMKEGEKNGKTWKKFVVYSTPDAAGNKQHFSTFSESFATIAKKSIGRNPVKISYVAGPYGNDLTGIEIIEEPKKVVEDVPF